MLKDLEMDAYWQQIEMNCRAWAKAHPDFSRAISINRHKLYKK